MKKVDRQLHTIVQTERGQAHCVVSDDTIKLLRRSTPAEFKMVIETGRGEASAYNWAQ